MLMHTYPLPGSYCWDILNVLVIDTLHVIIRTYVYLATCNNKHVFRNKNAYIAIVCVLPQLHVCT